MNLFMKMKFIYENVDVDVVYKHLNHVEYDENVDEYLFLFDNNISLIVNYKNEIDLKFDDEFVDDDVDEYENIIDEIIDEYRND